MTADRIRETAQMLLEAAARAGMFVTGDQRIGENDAAALLGWCAESLANKRREGSGPPAYNLGGRGHRVTYRVHDLAAWIELQRAE